ncbi:MAG: DUF4956 domain-containing protein [Clostridiaceae bacterium]|nr:DUF4956 domain-containing protein [Clostridiaceae bacterium]
MPESLFASILSTATGLTFTSYAFCMLTALASGALIAFVYRYRTTCTKSFLITLAMLPAIVGAVILMVNGNLGAGVAVAGTFSLVRFRSVPGTAREIGAIFLAMAAGLAVGMGYLGFAILFTLLLCVIYLVYTHIGFREDKNAAFHKILRITIPEDLDYTGVFDDIFTEFTSACELTAVKTTNMGSLFKLTYQITLRDPKREKDMIDKLRCRNGNLEISSSREVTESEL